MKDSQPALSIQGREAQGLGLLRRGCALHSKTLPRGRSCCHEAVRSFRHGLRGTVLFRWTRYDVTGSLAGPILRLGREAIQPVGVWAYLPGSGSLQRSYQEGSRSSRKNSSTTGLAD